MSLSVRPWNLGFFFFFEVKSHCGDYSYDSGSSWRTDTLQILVDFILQSID